MSCFPLYDNLVSQKRNKRFLSKVEKRNLINDVARLDQNGHNKIIALILYHQKINNIDMPNLILSEKMEINLASLPVPLQEIIEIFVAKHLIFMADEEKRKEH